MDESSEENSRQADFEELVEAGLDDSLNDENNSEDTSFSIAEDSSTDESEPRKDTKEDLHRADNSIAGSSTTEDSRLDEFSISDVPTRQASTSPSTSLSTSSSLSKTSEPLSIPSTSRGVPEVADAAESSPKRPTNFGRNVKQAIHVFHPVNPRSILQRVPVPIHSGRWVYLRDSPESSDYGGSPDSLEDLFLMEALDVETPESETEDSCTPRNEEMRPCPPPIQVPVLDSDSPSGEIEGAIGDVIPEAPIQVPVLDSDSLPEKIEGAIGSLILESPIQVPVVDLDSPSVEIEGAIGGLISESIHTELESEPSHSSTSRDVPFDFARRAMTSEDIGNKAEQTERPFGDATADHTEYTVGNYSSELGTIVGNVEDVLLESSYIEELIFAGRTFDQLLSNWDQMKKAIMDLFSGPRDVSNEETFHDGPSASVGGISEPLHQESDDVKLNSKDNPTESGLSIEIIEDSKLKSNEAKDL